MTAPRIIVPGATTAITRRTNLRKAFLSPWHSLVPQIWLYSIADAQRKTGVAVHHANCVITHHHLECTPQRNNLPDFTRYMHRDISCALNTLLAQERYDCPRELFDGRDTHYMRLLDAQAQASTLIYSHNNCVAAGLVSRPEHMPGHTFDFELWKTGYLDVKRPPIYFEDERPELIRLEITPPPLLYEAFDGDIDKLVYHMKRLSEDAARHLNNARRRAPLGARRIQRLHPWSEPRTLRESGGHQVPTFRLGAQGPEAIRAKIEAAEQTRGFRQEYKRTRLARAAGEQGRIYPYGSYAVHKWYGAPVADAPMTGNTVIQPGPLLNQVCERLQEYAQSELRHDNRKRFDLVDDVRVALFEKAIDIADEEELDFEFKNPTSPSNAMDIDGQPTPDKKSVQRHRFERRSEEVDRGASRVIVLRDLRRGRVQRHRDKHGVDPPV